MESLDLEIPEQLKDQAEEVAEEKGYFNTSEYARQALREKLETDLVTVRDEEAMVSIDEARKSLRKDAAVSKLEDIVEEAGVPAYWKTHLQKVRDEMIEEDLISDDFSIRKIYEYTRERRVELEQEYHLDSDYQDFAKELVQDREFVFGGASKEQKQLRAKEYILEEYPECSKSAIENISEKAVEKAGRWLMSEGVLSNSYQALIDQDEFEQRISEAFEFADFQSEQDGGENQ